MGGKWDLQRTCIGFATDLDWRSKANINHRDLRSLLSFYEKYPFNLCDLWSG